MMSTSEIWTAYHDRLGGYVARHVRQQSDRDDVLQDLFSKIHAGLPTLRDESRLEAWLFRLARRAVVDLFRKRRPLPPAGEPTAVAAEEVPSKDVASWLPSMVDALPDPDREALVLADVQGLPQGDVAARLGISLSGAKSRIQRARLKLKDALLDCCDLSLDGRGIPIAFEPKHAACSCDSCG